MPCKPPSWSPLEKYWPSPPLHLGHCKRLKLPALCPLRSYDKKIRTPTRETWKIRMARVAKEVNEMSNEICIDSELVKTHNPLKPIDLQKFLQLDWPLTDPRRHAVHSSCI